jgi:hypothetical protein
VSLPLARALEDSVLNGRPATLFVVRLNPSDAQALLGDQPRLADKLAGELIHAARELGLTLLELPEVTIRPDHTLRLRHVEVSVEAQTPLDRGASAGTNAAGEAADAGPAAAFIILDGARTVPLAGPLVSLGRRLDNHIIVDDPRVSRAHAQLRLRGGRYILYDLGSNSGTFVNGQRVEECVLRPGDVISLGGVSLIYGEDEAAAHGRGSGTRPFPARRP